MPGKNKKVDKGFEEYFKRIQMIGAIESNNEYDPVQQTDENGKPVSSAKGKYQYLWSEWGDTIKKKAKEWGYQVSTPEEFVNNPRFQEEFFQWDQKQAYKEVLDLKKQDKKLNLSLVELGVLRHHRGIGAARKAVQTGKLPGATEKNGKITNPPAAEYINRFRKTLSDANLIENPLKQNNLDRAFSLDQKEKRKIFLEYEKEMKEIRKVSKDPLIRNSLEKKLAEKFFKAGNLEIVNRGIDYRNNANKKKADYENKIEPERLTKNREHNANRGSFEIKDDGTIKWYDNTKKRDKKTFFKPVLKERYSLDNYEVEQEFLPVEETPLKKTDNNQPSGNSNTSSDKPQTTTAETKVETKVATKLDDPLDVFDDGTDLENIYMKYEKGNYEFPFEALASMAMGVAGMKAADTKIPFRDEQISQGLLNYASDLAKISKIGLPPEIEADLKNKLATAYQTGLTNIVRASGGNRNQVLGNQGQLDNARMSSIVQIAAMDIDRRDKAMAAYGDVLQYINEFDKSRDIANNERKYNEAKLKQGVGMQVAAAGFSKLIEDLNYQKEFGPGSTNDMLSQAWLTNIYGYNPKAKDNGEGNIVGTKSHFDKQAEEFEKKKTEGKKYRDFLMSLNPDERQKIAKIQEEKPSLNPKKNYDNFSTDSLIEAYRNFGIGKTVSQEPKKDNNAEITPKDQTTSIVEILNPQDDSSSGYSDPNPISPNQKSIIEMKQQRFPISRIYESYSLKRNIDSKENELNTVDKTVNEEVSKAMKSLEIENKISEAFDKIYNP